MSVAAALWRAAGAAASTTTSMRPMLRRGAVSTAGAGRACMGAVGKLGRDGSDPRRALAGAGDTAKTTPGVGSARGCPASRGATHGAVATPAS